MGGHDEREQTLNQLLVEMDGFDSSKGVIIMAATNRPEVLDAALLRAGRFDRQVVVDRPDVRGREAILRVHARHVRLAPEVSLQIIAARTPGFAGADLANIVNEAALLAARKGKDAVEQADLEEAIDRVVAGLERRSRVLSETERDIVAHHEMGHALVAFSTPRADPVHKVTIIPRGVAALGITYQLPTEDRYILRRTELEDRIAVMLGGHAAEELVYGELSTGAHNDLERATGLARAMVMRYGMSERLGPLTFGGDGGPSFLRRNGAGWEAGEREYSEETARAIDEEVRRIIDVIYERVRALLGSKKDVLLRAAEVLKVRETLRGRGAPPPPGRGAAADGRLAGAAAPARIPPWPSPTRTTTRSSASRRTPTPRRSSPPTGSSPGSTTPTRTRVTRPRPSASRRSTRPTRSSPTRRSASGTTRSGRTGPATRTQARAASAASRGGPGGGYRVHVDQSGDLGGFSEFFRTIFGDLGARQGGFQGVEFEDRGPFRSGARGRRGGDLETEVEISLEEAEAGARRTVEFQEQGVCGTCGGTGRQGKAACPTCGGSGRVSRSNRVEVKIPAGVRDGSRVRAAGEGGAGVGGGGRGDLYLRVHVTPHPVFERREDDLHVELPIAAWEAALGAEVQVPTLRGKVSMKIPPETSSGRTFRLPGYGVPHLKGGKGDQFVRVRVVVPTGLSPRSARSSRSCGALRPDPAPRLRPVPAPVRSGRATVRARGLDPEFAVWRAF